MLRATDPELCKLFVSRVGQCPLIMKRKEMMRIEELPGRFQGWEPT
jgi:hypothetical protein